jgi:hAT family C-terminal dimerisation region
MAMDYLLIQATSVPCEQVFSSSSETMTKRRNRIKPKLMEALQMLKFMLKKQRLNFTDTGETPAAEMLDDHEDTGMLEDILGAQDMELDKVLETLDEEE